MIEQTTLVNFITVLTGFIAIGGVLDSLTAKYRKSNSFSVKKPNYHEVLSVFYEGVYDRLLPGNPLSKHYMIRSVILAILFLVFTYNVVTFGSENIVNIDSNNWLFQLTLFIFYLFIFWLISAQTKLFISESLLSKNGLSKFVFVSTDILASSNIFIFLFSLGLLISANIHAYHVLNPASNSKATSVEVLISKKIIGNLSGKAIYEYDVKLIPLVDGKVVEKFFTISEFILNTSRGYIDPNMFIPAIPDFVAKEEEYSKQFMWALISSKVNGELISSADQIKKIISSNSQIDYAGVFSIPPSKYALPLRHYSLAYTAIDKMEDGFWNLFDVKVAFSTFLDVFDYFGGFTPYFNQPFCIYDGTNIIVSQVYYRGGKNECYDDIHIVSGKQAAIASYKNSAIIDNVLFNFPVSPYFIACMLLSLVFYTVVACSFILLVIKYSASRFRLINNVYELAPFTLSGGILALVIWSTFVSF